MSDSRSAPLDRRPCVGHEFLKSFPLRHLNSIFRATVLVAVYAGSIFGQAPVDLPNGWSGMKEADVLAIPEIGHLPFVAQDQILSALYPAKRTLFWDQRRVPLLEAERERAKRENRKPRSVLVWAKGDGVSFDYFTDGEHYYGILLHPLFVSVKIVEYEKFVRAWVYVSNDKGSNLAYDVFARDVS